jgi:phage gp46-like protein
MADIALVFSEQGFGDVVMQGQDLARDDGLESAVLLSLFTDRRAVPSQLSPGDDASDLRGYWGDIVPAVEGDQHGSLLWTLGRAKQTRETLQRAREYCEQALAWLIEDRVTHTVTVEAEYIGRGLMGIAIQIVRPDGARVEYRYDYEWAAQAAKAS